jgi:hypothetical protein
MGDLKHGKAVRVGGLNLRNGETVTCMEPSAVMIGKWYVRLRSGGIALYAEADLEPIEESKDE